MSHETVPKKEKSGQVLELAAAVLKQLPRDLSPDQMQYWIGHQRKLGAVLRQVLTGDIDYLVTVDYNQSLQQMIEAGHYTEANSDITEKHFIQDIIENKDRGKVETTLTLVHFNRRMSSDGVLKKFAQRDLRPGTLPELLAFGAKYPDIQRRFLIIALGSLWKKPEYFCLPELDGNSAARYLFLRCFDDGYHSSCRFLAVRK